MNDYVEENVELAAGEFSGVDVEAVLPPRWSHSETGACDIDVGAWMTNEADWAALTDIQFVVGVGL